MNAERKIVYEKGLANLPPINYHNSQGKNGEELATDEAAIWKRVLNYRITRELHPKSIYETHPGFGISTAIYNYASPCSIVYNQETIKKFNRKIELLDIDPFGQPWDFIEDNIKYISAKTSVLMVSNGEAFAVRRNLRNAQRYPTKYYGKKLPLWVQKEYLPKLEQITKMKVQFYYAFPTTVRAILSNKKLPVKIWQDCPKWMWWLIKYYETS